MLAAMLADFLWTIFMIAGVEQVRFVPHTLGAANYLVAVNIAFSHSLLTDAVWATLFAAVFFMARRSRRGAWLLFAIVLSHWVLDVVSHTPDMPLAPGTATRLGLGLWSSVPATIVVEGGCWLAAIVLYQGVTRARTRVNVFGLWLGAALLTLIRFNNIAGPPPPNPRTAPIASLVFFSLVVAWAYWIDRHPRRVREP